MERLQKLLEVYGLEGILEAADLTEIEVLAVLEEQGLLDDLELPEPL